jgi:hypothetical protein
MRIECGHWNMVDNPIYSDRVSSYAIVLSSDDQSERFEADATWWLRPGLADSEWISFEAYNRPGYYIGQQFGVVALVELNDNMTDIMREDATFLEER